MIDITVRDSETGKLLDISEVVTSITWETQMEDQPGKLTFDMIGGEFKEGSLVVFKYNNVNVFYGYVFKRSISSNGIVNITAYDQMRYLQNKDTYVLSNMTIGQAVKKICVDKGLDYRIVNDSSFVCPQKIFDNKSYYEIIKDYIDLTIMNTKQWFIIRDNFGTIELVELTSLRSNLLLGDGSLLTDFTYDIDIDSDTFNQVKLVKENKETQKREIYLTKDSSTIAKWGLLQFFETVDEQANEAQIKEKADNILKLKNRPTKSIKLTCIGDIRVVTGSGITIAISDLEKEGFGNKYAFVEQCTHNFTNSNHTMDLTLTVGV